MQMIPLPHWLVFGALVTGRRTAWSGTSWLAG